METKVISSGVDNISLNSEAAESQKLCKIWPNVKSGLQILQGMVKNPIVKYTIAGIITAGDAIVGKLCD